MSKNKEDINTDKVYCCIYCSKFGMYKDEWLKHIEKLHTNKKTG